MKAVIVEVRGEKAAALLENGQFVRIPDNAYAVGQEITLYPRETAEEKTQNNKHMFRQRFAAIAASAALVLSAGGGGLAYAMPYGTVSIDVNPSIEYTINRFDRVLRVSGVNEEGQAVLEEIGSKLLVNRKIEQALAVTYDQLREDGYLSDESNSVILSSGTGSDKHSAALAMSLRESLPSSADVYSVAVSRGEIEKAHEKGTTAGRMHLVSDLERENPETYKEHTWIDRPVNDLLREMRRDDRSSSSRRELKENEDETLSFSWKEVHSASEEQQFLEMQSDVLKEPPAPSENPNAETQAALKEQPPVSKQKETGDSDLPLGEPLMPDKGSYPYEGFHSDSENSHRQSESREGPGQHPFGEKPSGAEYD